MQEAVQILLDSQFPSAARYLELAKMRWGICFGWIWTSGPEHSLFCDDDLRGAEKDPHDSELISKLLVPSAAVNTEIQYMAILNAVCMWRSEDIIQESVLSLSSGFLGSNPSHKSLW